MNERQILFKGPMVRAILDGRKTQARRVINPQPVGSAIPAWCGDTIRWDNSPSKPVRCPYGQPGDQLQEAVRWFLGISAAALMRD